MVVAERDLTFVTALGPERTFPRADITVVEIADWPVWTAHYTIIRIVLTGDRRPSWSFKPGSSEFDREVLNEFGWPLTSTGWDGGRPLFGP